MKTIKGGNGLVMERSDSLSTIADHCRGRRFGFVVIPPELRSEFDQSPYAGTITRSVEEIHFNEFENNPKYMPGVTAFDAMIEGKNSLVGICQNLGNGTFLVERVSDGGLFRISGRSDINSIIQVGQNPGWTPHRHLFKQA